MTISPENYFSLLFIVAVGCVSMLVIVALTAWYEGYTDTKGTFLDRKWRK